MCANATSLKIFQLLKKIATHLEREEKKEVSYHTKITSFELKTSSSSCIHFITSPAYLQLSVSCNFRQQISFIKKCADEESEHKKRDEAYLQTHGYVHSNFLKLCQHNKSTKVHKKVFSSNRTMFAHDKL